MKNRSPVKQHSPDPGAKAGRTRVAILAAAEQLFARNGYATTRLEDVAEILGLTRAALFYYFRDKQALYNAMLEDVFGSLAIHLDEALSAEGTLAKRLERAVEVWVDAIAARPTMARLILRYVVDAEQQPLHQIYSSSERLRRTFWDVIEQGRASGELKPLHEDPFHATSAIVGHTVFYVSALAALIPADDFKSLAPEQVAAHKKDLIQTMQHQLGITPGRRARKKA